MNKLPFCIINYLFQKLDIVDIIKYSESCKINHDLFIKYKNKNPKVAKVINAIKCNSPRAANLIVELEDYSLLKFITSQTVKITSKINLRFLEKLKKFNIICEFDTCTKKNSAIISMVGSKIIWNKISLNLMRENLIEIAEYLKVGTIYKADITTAREITALTKKSLRFDIGDGEIFHNGTVAKYFMSELIERLVNENNIKLEHAPILFYAFEKNYATFIKKFAALDCRVNIFTEIHPMEIKSFHTCETIRNILKSINWPVEKIFDISANGLAELLNNNSSELEISN